MIRAMRRGGGSPEARPSRDGPRSFSRRNNRHSTAFARRSLGLSNAVHRSPRRTASGPVDSAPPEESRSRPAAAGAPVTRRSSVLPIASVRSFDPLALVRRLPVAVRSFGYVKSARSLAMFSRFERYWLELRGIIVVMVVDEDSYAAHHIAPGERGVKENIIAGVFSVEKCQVMRSRSAKSAVVRLSKPGHPTSIWLRFEDENECDVWEKALRTAASQRVVGISDFEFVSPIGKGASGKVFLVTDRKTGDKLALKVIDKAKVFESRSGFRHALDERLALEMVDGHPFFSRLRYAFQTRQFFYLAIDFYDGGDLYQYLRTHHGRLKEQQVRSVAAEVSLALEHLHKLGFVYRDLKPENVLLDSKGHVRLADFGLCKLLNNKSLTNTICGTHTYAAPEMLAVRNYGISIDLWAFGVFVYHILRGRTPYEARDLDQVIANMNNRRIRFSSSTSPELVSMIKKLLDWNPETRLGCGPAGMVEVRGHSFFKGMDWRKVYMRESEEGGLFTKRTRSTHSRHNIQPRNARPGGEVVPPVETVDRVNVASCVAALNANENGETPSPVVLMEGGEGAVNSRGGRPGIVEQIAPLNDSAAAVSTNDSCDVPEGTIGDSDDSPSSARSKSKRMIRPKSEGRVLGGRKTSGRAERKGSLYDQSQSISLREKMVDAAEQDDLRNFDMSEWGKISVDNDHDDANYGDASLWPISKARRTLVESERMIAGFTYCSTSKPLSVPDNL